VLALQGGRVLLSASLTLALERKPFLHSPDHWALPRQTPPTPPASQMSAEARALLDQGFGPHGFLATSAAAPGVPQNALNSFLGSDHVFLDLAEGALWTSFAIEPTACDAAGNVQVRSAHRVVVMLRGLCVEGLALGSWLGWLTDPIAACFRVV
jgi:hypothetical protein